ncbi:AlbA family DNA-binding domain-containing protein [Hydromonas duriensis]|uniref:Putative DNA-binding protein n=1 Tax=Hydromonas duriensis TaxID=1527608 RepID=A0A4R6YBS6_9BURK|nr:ATP-binding protein [Hydromonas duriensis]TDR33102.1 putative DNA-binding protein [Hydromonas duriensis]
MELQDTIKELINSKKEGQYWDFKESHHANNAELIHDIICLANTEHQGDRFLIYGVNNSGEVIGVPSKNRKTQAQLIDTFRAQSFSDQLYPDISLKSIKYDDKEIDVLTIKNQPHKPYYITKDITEPKQPSKQVVIRAHHIYSRVMDSNTPQNSSANSKQIEQMWRERFGLTQPPLEKLRLYLNDAENWAHDDEGKFYYKYHPEFTIQSTEAFAEQGCETLEWARGEIGYSYTSGNNTYCWTFYYHNTKLFQCVCCNFDGGKKNIVNPDWSAVGSGRIYYYLKDSFEYCFHNFMLNHFKDRDDSKNLNRVTSSQNFDIPVFESENQLQDFLSFSKTKLNIKSNEPTLDNKEQNRLFYELLDIYTEFQNQKEI